MRSIFILFAAFLAIHCAEIEIKKIGNGFERILKNNKEGNRDWWETAVFYQIYPRSFKDSNNDGIGDLKGIIQKFNHIKDAGITAVWLSPIFKSPQVDQGYDISDYCDIDPDYGTMDELKELLDVAHKLEIKIIMDFVPNHTSDQHQWFKDSEDLKEGFEDFYVWHNGTQKENGDRIPPNNWVSIFKGSAWTWSEKRKQYYLHQFASAQPDLNYRNPKVVDAIMDVLTFWLNIGVDGFRIDAVPFLFEDEIFRDEPKSIFSGLSFTDYDYLDHTYTKDLNETFDVIYKFRELIDSYNKKKQGDTRIIMTEAYTTYENTLLYYGTKGGGRLRAHFTFNFNLITDLSMNSSAENIANSIFKWQELDSSVITYNWVLGNHDNHRTATRFGIENIDGYNMLVAMLPGVGVTYNGEEIGMEDGEVTCEEGKDPSAVKNCDTFNKVSRDFERTPFHWDNTTNAGFNDGAKSWLPVSQKYLENNLATQNITGIKSHFNVYKQLMEIRDAFKKMYAKESWVTKHVNDVLFLSRTAKDLIGNIVYSYTLVFNAGNEPKTVNLDTISEKYKVLLTSVNSSRKNGDIINANELNLAEHEGMVVSPKI